MAAAVAWVRERWVTTQRAGRGRRKASQRYSAASSCREVAEGDIHAAVEDGAGGGLDQRVADEEEAGGVWHAGGVAGPWPGSQSTRMFWARMISPQRARSAATRRAKTPRSLGR